MVNEKDRASRESSIASGWTVEGQTGEQHASELVVETGLSDPLRENNSQADNAGEQPKQLSSISLVLLGLVGGIYLFYTVVWFSWADHYATMNALVAAGSGSLGGVLQQLVFWLTPFAPALWFVSVLVLCRGAKKSKYALWLFAGAIVLVPLPMFGGVF